MILVSEAGLPSLTPFWSGQEWRCRKWKRSWSRIELKGTENQSQYLHRSSTLLCHWSQLFSYHLLQRELYKCHHSLEMILWKCSWSRSRYNIYCCDPYWKSKSLSSSSLRCHWSQLFSSCLLHQEACERCYHWSLNDILVTGNVLDQTSQWAE